MTMRGNRENAAFAYMQTTAWLNLESGYFVPAAQLHQRDAKTIRDSHQRIALARGVEHHAR